MDRLARNLNNLRRLVQTFIRHGIRIEFVKECLSLSGEVSQIANLLLSVMGTCAESVLLSASGSVKGSH
jgi:DNA invertase Pin-like site-specific DNA recombinase